MFLEKVIADVLASYENFPSEKMIFVVPNKRAVLFLKKYFSNQVKKVCISPKFLSISEFIEQISECKIVSALPLLFELYQVYLENCSTEPDDFETFMGWGQTILNDFNEIDQYLVNPQTIFPYIKAIKEVEHWSLSEELTPLQQQHLNFWNSLGKYYYAFSEKLLKNKQGYKGLVYAQATKNLLNYIQKSKDTLHIFAGFNALTKSEEFIIHEILMALPSEIYWDADAYFLDDKSHDAGFFIRQYFEKWDYYKTNMPKWKENLFLQPKKIKIIGVPKSVNQAHYLGSVVEKISENNLGKTAVILADEKLLVPVIQSINTNNNPLNITMGYPLKYTLLNDFFTAFFRLHTSKRWYYKEVEALLLLPIVNVVFSEKYLQETLNFIRKQNYVYLSVKELQRFAILENDKELTKIIFSKDTCKTANDLLSGCLKFISVLKEELKKDTDKNALLLEYLYAFYRVFNQLLLLQNKYQFVSTPKTLHHLFQNLVLKETLDFQGEPLQGLQLMGMLESQNLDFENVILLSVNEGILPTGNVGNSFIPFDVKNQLGLPTYKHRDAIFSYHFYRLLQRAKNIELIYNTESDALKGSEKSRFILQLFTIQNENITISEEILSPQASVNQYFNLVVEKTPTIFEKLHFIATNKGFSPTALTTYIRNPIDFYLQTILNVREESQVEESIENRTFGDITHACLEELYSPFIGKILRPEHIEAMKKKVSALVEKYFKEFYREDAVLEGKNTLILSVIESYILRFLEIEKEISKNKEIEILALEKKITASVKIEEFNFEINLNGIADRIDRRDGILHIIDYKTGLVKSENVGFKFEKWNEIINDFKYSKSFQLLMYAYIIRKMNIFPDNYIMTGIYSFKNLKDGLLLFKQDENRGINDEILSLFEEKLMDLLSEIFNLKIPFIQKEV